jgi:DNA-binding SARP family transcriptional activator/predicted ATPase
MLGGLDIVFGNRPVAVEAPRLRSLLAYLLLHRTPQPRERLAFMFWPDSAESQARTNLRQALHLLRRALPEVDRFLDTDSRVVGWRADAPCTLDVEKFDELMVLAKGAREADNAAEERISLEAAAVLYSGDLLPECYDEWIAGDRERLRDEFLAGVARLAELYELRRDYRAAIPWARRWVQNDPVNEDACHRLMRLHALIGDRAGALRVYHGCATALARELGVAPGAAMTETYTRLLETEAPSEPRTEVTATATGTSPLVGRTGEWEALRDAWASAVAGESGLVVIMGEAGIGKSHLAEELRYWVKQQGFATAVSRCYMAAGSLAYAPVVELLRSPAIGPRIRRLAGPWVAEISRLLPELGAERPELIPASPVVDDWQRARLFDALSHAFLADERPLLLVIDDLQWCDRDTLGWLSYVRASKPGARLLVVGTARSEDLGADHPLHSLLLATRTERDLQIELMPLSPDETATLVANLSGETLDEDRDERLFVETEGNPLFVVEWIRAGLDELPSASTERGSGVDLLPPRAQSVIEARLAQLSPAGQELAGLAATVGRAFTFDLLTRASARREEQVVETLDELWRRRIVRERGADAYDFSHDKLREGAYWRASPARRRLLHRRVAQAMERLHSSDLDGVSGQLAAHYEHAGWLERSIEFYSRAATVAQEVYATEEAVELLSRALTLLDDLPPSRERAARELTLRTALGVALVVLRGYGTQEVTETYARARDLAEELGDSPTAPVLRGIGLSALVRGELDRGREIAQEILDLGVRENDPMVRVEGHYLLGVTAFWLGHLAEARDQLQLAIAGYAPDRARSHLAFYSQDPRVVCLSRLAYTLWHLGDADGATECSVEALHLAEQLEHPFSLGYALTFASWLAIDRDDQHLARELSGRLAELAEERQLGFLEPLGTILRGWRSVTDGESDAGIDMIRAGLDVYRRSGQPLYLPWSLRLLAEAYAGEGQLVAARAAITEALEVVEATEQRFLEAELHRLSAELVLLEGGDRAAAESQLGRALQVARRQGAVALERRAANSLERLRSATG